MSQNETLIDLFKEEMVKNGWHPYSHEMTDAVDSLIAALEAAKTQAAPATVSPDGDGLIDKLRASAQPAGTYIQSASVIDVGQLTRIIRQHYSSPAVRDGLTPSQIQSLDDGECPLPPLPSEIRYPTICRFCKGLDGMHYQDCAVSQPNHSDWQKVMELADEIAKLGNGNIDGNSFGNVLGQQIRAICQRNLGKE